MNGPDESKGWLAQYPFPFESDEWLAQQALKYAGGNTALAVVRLRGAVSVALRWQRLALFDAVPGPDEPKRG